MLAVTGKSSMKHAGVRALFNLHFVKEGIVPRDMVAVYNDLFEARQESDCQDFFTVDEATASDYLKPAEQFVKYIDSYLTGEESS